MKKIMTLQILSHDYSVFLCSDVHDDDGRQIDGACDIANNAIKIRCNDCSNSYRQSVIWHEITHAIFFHSGFGDMYKNENMISIISELFAQAMSTMKELKNGQ
jgi:hypothetical protein